MQKLMSKWWFRLALVVGLAAVFLIVNLVFATKEDPNVTKNANTGLLNLLGLLMYIAIVPMYLATDTMAKMQSKVGLIIRKVILLASFVFCIAMTTFGTFEYLKNVSDGDLIRPFPDGFAMAPFITYTLLYLFGAGRFANKENPNRTKQFLWIIVAYVLPVILGVVLTFVLQKVNSSVANYIVLIAIPVVLVILFIISAKSWGLLRNTVIDDDDYESGGSSYELGDDWEENFERGIEGYAYGTYAEVSASATRRGNKIYVDVSIYYFGSSNDEVIASRYRELQSDVRDAYRQIANKCPYASTLSIEVKD